MTEFAEQHDEKTTLAKNQTKTKLLPTWGTLSLSDQVVRTGPKVLLSKLNQCGKLGAPRGWEFSGKKQ